MHLHWLEMLLWYDDLYYYDECDMLVLQKCKCSSMLDKFVGHEYNVILAIMTSTYLNITQKKKRVKYI